MPIFKIDTVINTFKWIFAAIFVMFFAAICTIVSPIITHKPKIHDNIAYEKYQSIDIYEKANVLPESSKNINLYFIRDNRPGRMLFYVFHDANISNSGKDFDYIMAKCMESLPGGQDLKLYQNENISFDMAKFITVFDERFMPEWWNETSLKAYDQNKLVAWDNSGFWIFYNSESRSVKVFQWHESKEDLALLDRGLFEHGLMELFVNALSSGDVSTVKKLIASHPIKVFVNTEGRTALHFAVEHRDKSLAEFLLTNGFDKEARDKDDITPIYLAVDLKDSSMVELLVSKEVNVDYAINDGSTPLYKAVLNEDKKIEGLLLKAGPNLKNEVGFTPLHAAVLVGKTGMALYWIDKGVKINANINPTGYTPLHTAVNENNGEIVSLLLSKGADISLRDRYALTPLDLAMKKGYKNVEKLIREHMKAM